MSTSRILSFQQRTPPKSEGTSGVVDQNLDRDRCVGYLDQMTTDQVALAAIVLFGIVKGGSVTNGGAR